jgi:hypothetical protein
MDWLDHPASFEFVQGMLFGMCLMAFPAIVLVWSHHGRTAGMARLLEIKGLGADVAGIRSEIASIKSIAKDINTEAPLLKAEMADLRDQIREHRSDLRAEAGDMGNSSAETEKYIADEKAKVDAITAKRLAELAGQNSTTQQPGSTDASTEPGTGSDAHVGD